MLTFNLVLDACTLDVIWNALHWSHSFHFDLFRAVITSLPQPESPILYWRFVILYLTWRYGINWKVSWIHELGLRHCIQDQLVGTSSAPSLINTLIGLLFSNVLSLCFFSRDWSGHPRVLLAICEMIGLWWISLFCCWFSHLSTNDCRKSHSIVGLYLLKSIIANTMVVSEETVCTSVSFFHPPSTNPLPPTPPALIILSWNFRRGAVQYSFVCSW